MTKIIMKSGDGVVTLDSTHSYTTLRKKFTAENIKAGTTLVGFEGYSQINFDNVIAIIEDESVLSPSEKDQTIVTAGGVKFHTSVRMSSVVGNMENDKLYNNGFVELHNNPRSFIKKSYIDAVTYVVTEDVETDETEEKTK